MISIHYVGTSNVHQINLLLQKEYTHEKQMCIFIYNKAVHGQKIIVSWLKQQSYAEVTYRYSLDYICYKAWPKCFCSHPRLVAWAASAHASHSLICTLLQRRRTYVWRRGVALKAVRSVDFIGIFSKLEMSMCCHLSFYPKKKPYPPTNIVFI